MHIYLALSEDTRLDTVRVVSTCYDLHWDPTAQRFAWCRHGTLEVVAVMTRELLDLLTGENDH